MSTVKVSDAEFQSAVLDADGPVLVDYWAEWCGPCKVIGPALEEIASEMSGSIKIAKMNIDENPQTPSKYGVRGIPTLMLFKDGEVVATVLHLRNRARIRNCPPGPHRPNKATRKSKEFPAAALSGRPLPFPGSRPHGRSHRPKGPFRTDLPH